MKTLEAELIKQYMNTCLSDNSKEMVKLMVADSIIAFKSVITENRCKEEIDTLGSHFARIFDLMAIESAMNHHKILTLVIHEEQREQLIAHKCALVLIQEWLRTYERALTLEENIELWKLQKI